MKERVRVEMRDRAVDLGGRVPPNNREAEAAVISASLTGVEALDAALSTGLDPAEMYADANKRVFEAACEIHKTGQPVDTQTVAAYLKDRERLQSVGGIAYLATLVDATPTTLHVEAHAKIVREKARIRKLIEICQCAAAAGYGDYGDAQAFVDAIAQQLFELCDTTTRRRGRQMYDIVRENVEDMQRAIARGGALAGYPTGLLTIDARTGGLFPGELVIIAARPGMGKTALLLEYADHLAAQPGDEEFDGYAVHIFSYEMPDKQLVHRRTAARAQMDVSKLRRGGIRPDDEAAYVVAASSMSQLPIWIYDDPTITLMQARGIVRTAMHKMPRRKHVVMFDYIQLMPGVREAERREQEVAGVSRGLKVLAGELSVPVVANAQLNRDLEKRPKKRPVLSDLRDSGTLEQDADVVAFIFRQEMYEPKPENRYHAIVDIAKQRNGPTGECLVAYRDLYTRFENPTDADLARWRKERP